MSGSSVVEKVTLRHGVTGESCEVYPSLGACVTSYVHPPSTVPSEGRRAEARLSEEQLPPVGAQQTIQEGEVLFLSSKSSWNLGKPIRGGVPVVFPQFGSGPMQQHGFARNSKWSVEALTTNDAGDAIAVLCLGNNQVNPQLLATWGSGNEAEGCNLFVIRLQISLLADGLRMELSVVNRGSHAFTFTTALHTYFRVDSIQHTAISGLSELRFIDKLRDMKEFTELPGEKVLHEAHDRIYPGPPSSFQIQTPSRTIHIRQQDFSDVVLWNPWETLGSKIADLGPGEWTKFVCIEAGNVSQNVVLEPGKTWSAHQHISVSIP